MTIENVRVSLGDVNLADDTMELWVGPFGHRVRISEFRNLATGREKDPQAVLRNVAIGAGLAGVDIADKAAFSRYLSTVTFRH